MNRALRFTLLGLAVGIAGIATACGSDGGSNTEANPFVPPLCSGDPWPGGVRRFLTADDVMHRFKALTGRKLINRVGTNNQAEWVVLATSKEFFAVERALEVHVLARDCSSYAPWLLLGSAPGVGGLLWSEHPRTDRNGLTVGSCSFGLKRYPHSNIVVEWTGVDCTRRVDKRWARFDRALRVISTGSS